MKDDTANCKYCKSWILRPEEICMECKKIVPIIRIVVCEEITALTERTKE